MKVDFGSTVKLGVYYVDDSFVIFGSELEYDRFRANLNQLHPDLNFTVGKTQNKSLNFLDVLVEKEGTGFLTSIYRNQRILANTSVGIPSAQKQGKSTVINTLVNRAFMICSKTKLDSELDAIKQLLIDNGYPDDSLNSCLNGKLANISSQNSSVLKSSRFT